MQSGTLRAEPRIILGRSEPGRNAVERSARDERLNSGRQGAPPLDVRTDAALSRARIG